MKKRSVIEICRLIASLVILWHHEYVAKVLDPNEPFIYGWIFVEFFFVLTGYFTISHFSKKCEIV